jgi:DNA-binding response OmpR family regulator
LTIAEFNFIMEAQMKRFRILIVDDEVRILNFLVSKLRSSGYDVLTAANGLEGLEQVKAQEPDFIVLDVLMPRMDGMAMLKELRSFSTIPVIILTAKGTDTDRIRGLQLGADDYLPKPFNPDELVARIEAVRRRVGSSEKRAVLQTYEFGNIAVDFKNRNVTVAGEPKYLTRIEWLLLSQLISNAGRLMLYEELLTNVWGAEYRDDVQILRTWISRLRNKLGGEHSEDGIIRTIPKTGYIIDRPDTE